MKLVVLVLLLVLALFAVGLGAGFGNSRKTGNRSGECDDYPGWVCGLMGTLESLFGAPNTNLALERLQGACLSGRRVVLATGACSIRVAASEKKDLSRLRLRSRGAGVVVAYEDARASEDQEPVQKTLETGESLLVPVKPEGGRLTLACAAFARCELEIV
jgi:hypothetical protein